VQADGNWALVTSGVMSMGIKTASGPGDDMECDQMITSALTSVLASRTAHTSTVGVLTLFREYEAQEPLIITPMPGVEKPPLSINSQVPKSSEAGQTVLEHDLE
jgi:hypothetical protein